MVVQPIQQSYLNNDRHCLRCKVRQRCLRDMITYRVTPMLNPIAYLIFTNLILWFKLACHLEERGEIFYGVEFCPG